jgi:predicted regulator of Ras-like GTPase activity (Roadblock/LC7/MglB family)
MEKKPTIGVLMFTDSLPLMFYSGIAFFSFLLFIITVTLYVRKSVNNSRKYNSLFIEKQAEREKQAGIIATLQSKCISSGNSLTEIQNRYKNHLERLKPEFNKLFEQLKATQQQRNNIYSRYQSNMESYSTLANENARLQEQLTTLSKEVDDLRSTTSENGNLGLFEQQQPEAESELIKATAAINFYQIQNDQLQVRNEELSGKVEQIQVLKAEIELLKIQVQNKDREITQVDHYKEKVNELEVQRYDLSMHLEAISHRLTDLEELRKTAVLFESQKIELDELRLKVDTLRQNNTELMAKGLYLERPEIAFSSPESDTLLGSLSGLLVKLHSSPEIKAAAVADQIGLIVAETGPREYTEGLAGIAASFDTLNHHIHSFIPFGDLQQILITDKNDISITAFPVNISNEALMITILSTGPGPTQENVMQTLSTILNNNSGPSDEVLAIETEQVNV